MDPVLELILTIKALQRESERLMNEAMRPLGLTAAQADAVVVIGRAGPLSLKELGELLIAEAGSPSRLVDRLVEAGLVQRQLAGADRRRVELSLSPHGRSLLERILAVRSSMLARGRETLGDHDFGPVLQVLRELLQHTAYADLIARRRALEAGQPVHHRRDRPHDDHRGVRDPAGRRP
jgi:MarR family transcriptional regulator, organic hydroperoxide resistance regulator